MKLNLTKISSFFFLATLFFIPFDGVGIIPFGEFSSEAYIFFLLLFLVFFSFKLVISKLKIPKLNAENQVLFLLIFALIIASILNFYSILSNSHPLRSGVQKLISQFFVLFFFFPVVTLFFYNYFFTQSKVHLKIRKVLLISLYFVFIVGLIEVIYVYYKPPIAGRILDFFDQMPLIKIIKNTWMKRISSVTKEPPSLGMFLITVLPWILIFKPRTKKFTRYFLPLFAIFFLVFFSGSRSGIVIVALQVLLFFVLNSTHKMSIIKLKRIVNIGFFSMLILLVSLFSLRNVEAVKDKLESFNFVEKYNSNVSNKTRLGTYISSFSTIVENPLFGVGFGQAGFYVLEHYPDWATEDNAEIKRYKTGEKFPPMFNMYLRILIEGGIISLLLFLMFFYLVLLKSLKWYYKNDDLKKNQALLIILSTVGFFLTWIQFDTFRVLGFWLVFSYFLYINKQIFTKSVIK